MKTLKCDLCAHEASAETFEAWMEAMKPHYGEVHADFMAKKAELAPEEQQAEMKKWMDETAARFEAA